MTIRFSKDEMQKLMKTVKANVKAGKGQPKEVKMKDMSGKTHTLKKRQYCGLLDNQVKFYMSKARYPNYVTYLYDADIGSAELLYLRQPILVKRKLTSLMLRH